MATKCPDCGFDVPLDRNSCPECGCPIEHQQNPPIIPAPIQSTKIEEQPTEQSSEEQCECTPSHQTDWAQYFYECGVIGWKAFKKYKVFTGRSSRREFWSFNLVCCMLIGCTGGLGAIVCLLPMIGVSIRRMHDIGKCGWWSICPIACFFLFLKRSDHGANEYGIPNPAKNLL